MDSKTLHIIILSTFWNFVTMRKPTTDSFSSHWDHHKNSRFNALAQTGKDSIHPNLHTCVPYNVCEYSMAGRAIHRSFGKLE